MKFVVGDKVRFLNEKGEGEVCRIINKHTVAVRIEDGFEIPFAITELVLAQTKVAPESDKPAPEAKSVGIENRKKEEAIFLAITPEKPENISISDFNLWLINSTSYDIMYVCSLLSNNGFKVFGRGEAKPFESKLLETIARKNLDDFASIKMEALFYNLKKYDHKQPVSEIVKLKQSRLYKENAFVKNDYLPEKALLINVTGLKELFFETEEGKRTDLSKVLFQKNLLGNATKISRPHKKNDSSYEMEIDLHIEELIDNYSGMSNAEIVIIQIRHFQKALDEAISGHYRILTVIHGVGNGRLKSEVRNIISSAGLRFHDAPYSKYGFGATEIIF